MGIVAGLATVAVVLMMGAEVITTRQQWATHGSMAEDRAWLSAGLALTTMAVAIGLALPWAHRRAFPSDPFAFARGAPALWAITVGMLALTALAAAACLIMARTHHAETSESSHQRTAARSHGLLSQAGVQQRVILPVFMVVGFATLVATTGAGASTGVYVPSSDSWSSHYKVCSTRTRCISGSLNSHRHVAVPPGSYTITLYDDQGCATAGSAKVTTGDFSRVTFSPSQPLC